MTLCKHFKPFWLKLQSLCLFVVWFYAGCGFPMASEAVCVLEGEVQWIADQLVPSWTVPIERVNFIRESCGNLFDSIEQGCWPVARFSFCEGCNVVCPSARISMAPCEYCNDGSLMPMSQRAEGDSLDSAVCGTGGCDLELAPPEQQSDCWSVFSEYEVNSASVCELAVLEHQIDCWSELLGYDGEIVSRNTFFFACDQGEGWWWITGHVNTMVLECSRERQSPGMAVGVHFGEEGIVGGAHVPDGVLGVANDSRPDSICLNYQDCEELRPSGLDVDADDHRILFGSQESGALKLVACETDSETVVRGVMTNVDLDVVSFVVGLSSAGVSAAKIA